MKCRHCFSSLSITLIDLGSAPLSNAYLKKEQLLQTEKWYPLKILVCSNCWLVQTIDYANREECFTEHYAYLSSYSTSWLTHCKNYVDKMIAKFSLSKNSMVGEVAANDGYLLQYFKNKAVPCYGIEPTINTAALAKEKGLNIFVEFFGAKLAKQLNKQHYLADLLVANNVLAHVPDINDFVKAFAYLLKPTGVATFEFPHLCSMIKEVQFDTIYHEHFSYLSFTAVKKIFESQGLNIFDVELLPTHGGSLRIYAQRQDRGMHKITAAVNNLLYAEANDGVQQLSFYTSFKNRILDIKRHFLNFLLTMQHANTKVVAYGAAAKGNTLINYFGIRSDLIHYVVDKNPEKIGKYLPGSRISIKPESALIQDKPEWIVILPWNLRKEIMEQLSYIKQWGGKFVTVIPQLSFYE